MFQPCSCCYNDFSGTIRQPCGCCYNDFSGTIKQRLQLASNSLFYCTVGVTAILRTLLYSQCEDNVADSSQLQCRKIGGILMQNFGMLIAQQTELKSFHEALQYIHADSNHFGLLLLFAHIYICVFRLTRA